MAADFYPRLAGVAEDNEKVNSLVTDQLQVGALLALPGIVGTIAFAPYIVRLFYSSQFAPAADLMPWFVFGVYGMIIMFPLGMIQRAKAATKWMYFGQTEANLGHMLLAVLLIPNFGLIGVHLTNFDSVSDLCGTIPAMQLEQASAALLLRQPGTQFAARLSAGRYALVIEADTVAQVRTVAREVYSQLAGQRFSTEHGNLRLQACVGGLLIDRHALINSEDCLASLADALAIAASVRDPQLFVEPLSQMMIDSRRAHQSKIEHIREAVQETRLELYAQPVVDPDAPEGTISYEVLTRLRDRDGGLIQPPEFLTLAVQAQMSVPVDRAVVKRAFEWLATHPVALARTHKCSINLSGATMSDGAIADYIKQQRALYDVPAERIVFEITESEAIRNPSAASRLVDELKSQGFGIALDDFGTGLATFEYLKRFPLDYLKIDGSFIRNLTTSPIDEEIVMSTVRVARRLKLRTIAEHVHSEHVHERLREIGVDYLQGDLFGKPEPIATLFAKFPEFARDEVSSPGATGLAADAEPAVASAERAPADAPAAGAPAAEAPEPGGR